MGVILFKIPIGQSPIRSGPRPWDMPPGLSASGPAPSLQRASPSSTGSNFARAPSGAPSLPAGPSRGWERIISLLRALHPAPSPAASAIAGEALTANPRAAFLHALAAGRLEIATFDAASLRAPDFVEALLREAGPVYASEGLRLPRHSAPGDRSAGHAVNGAGCWRRSSLSDVLPLEHETGGVLVVGANTDTGTIEYREGKDHGESGAAGKIPFDTFIRRRRGAGLTCTLVALRCPERAARLRSAGGCPHAARSLILDTDG